MITHSKGEKSNNRNAACPVFLLAHPFAYFKIKQLNKF